MKAPPTIDLDNMVVDVSIDHKRKRDEHWARLRRARSNCPTPNTYPDWLEQTQGIKVHMNAGMITDEYTVVDEKKYLIYLLKFG